MALTQVKTSGLADDAVTGAKIADDTVAEANMANDAISLTELKAGTDGQIITYDASGNPTAVGPGTDGQVLTSTGAGSPPAFEDLPASGVTVSNNSNNRVVTGDGSNLNAEANLTFDGTKLGIGTDTHWLDKVTIKNDVSAGTHNWMLHLLNGTHAGDSRAGIAFQGNNATAANTWDGAGIYGANDGATGACNLHLGKVVNGSFTEELKVAADGQVTITDGDLVIGTSGHGISFAATSDGGTGTPVELLDDYEEGIWAPDPDLGSCTVDHASYTKVGDVVTCFFQCSAFSNTAASNGVNLSTPFAAQNTKNGSTGFNTTVGAATGKNIHSDAQSLTPSLTMNAGGSLVTFSITSDTESWDVVRHQDLETNHVLQGFFTYKVA